MRIMKAQKPLVDTTFYSKMCSLMKSIKNFHFPNTDFKTVFGQILHPESHGVLRSLRKLVTRRRKYDWRSRKTLKLNINIKKLSKAKNGKLKEFIFNIFLK